MWNVDPKMMCNRHLLGEHCEMHMAVGAINAGKSVAGHVKAGQLDVSLIRKRHMDLAMEMRRRGMNHHSPLPALQHLPRGGFGKDCVDAKANIVELARRCSGCKLEQAAAIAATRGLAKYAASRLRDRRIEAALKESERKARGTTTRKTIARLARAAKLARKQGMLF